MQSPWKHTLFEFTKLPTHAYRWPTSSPLHQPPPRLSRRSELRFSPAKTVTEQWVARSLKRAHILLRAGKERSALALCYNVITLPRGSCLEFLHSAVSLFTRHGSFEAALELCNRMIDIGFLLQNKTFMLLLRGDHSQRAEFLDKICEAMARGGVKMDDLAFKSVLDTMVKHGCPPRDLEDALTTYQKSQDKDWAPTVGIYHTIIHAWSSAGGFQRAVYWLSKYRGRSRERKPDPPPNTYLFNTNHIKKDALHEPDPPTQSHSPSDAVRNLYASILIGLVKSPKPVVDRIQWLLSIMRQDGISLDIEMYNMIIRSFLHWGMTSRAFSMFEELLRPGSSLVPDAYTFRPLFIALNPLRSRNPNTARHKAAPEDISTRRVFSALIKVSRLRLRSRKPPRHKNLISTATFNCALGTFCAQDDYAAAWTVLALFTWFHIIPDAKTSRIVVHSLLRRMRYEMGPAFSISDLLWMDRFSFERRSTMVAKSQKMLLADRLYMIGRLSVAEMKHEGFQWYLRPSHAFDNDTAIELEFMIALLRSALRAELGFKTLTFQAVEAERAISKAMLQARHDMVPRGRSERN